MPRTNGQNHSKGIDEEDERRILGLYQNEYKKFEKSFGILLGFALVFLFIILLPYVSTLEKGHSINNELKNLTSEINKTIIDTRYLNSAGSGLGNLSSLLGNFPSEMEKSFINLRLVQISLELERFRTNVNKFFNQSHSDQEINQFTKILENLSQRVRSIVNYNATEGASFSACSSVNVTFRTHCNLNEEIHREIEKFVNNLRSDYNLEEPSFLFPI